ncbi:hypothetical protein AAZX31_09G075200 [Glycine max]
MPIQQLNLCILVPLEILNLKQFPFSGITCLVFLVRIGSFAPRISSCTFLLILEDLTPGIWCCSQFSVFSFCLERNARTFIGHWLPPELIWD